MKSSIAILIGAAAVAVFVAQTYSGLLRPQASMPVLLQQAFQLGSFALIAFLVGFVVERRGWLAASAAYLIGLTLWVVVDLRPTPPWIPTDAHGTWEAVIGRAVIGGLWSALVGGAGSWAARTRSGASARRGTVLS